LLTVLFGQLFRTFVVLGLVVVLTTGCGTQVGPNGGKLYGFGTPAGGIYQYIEHIPDKDNPDQPAPADPLPPTLDLGQFFIGGHGWQDGFSLTVNANGEIVFELGQAVRGGQGPFMFELVNADDGKILAGPTGGNLTYKFSSVGTFHLVIRITDANLKVVQTPIFTIIVVMQGQPTGELKVSFTADRSSYLRGETVHFVINVQGGKAPYKLKITFYNSESTPMVTMDAPGDYLIDKGFVTDVTCTDQDTCQSNVRVTDATGKVVRDFVLIRVTR
jgi:hypothetical protein